MIPHFQQVAKKEGKVVQKEGNQPLSHGNFFLRGCLQVMELSMSTSDRPLKTKVKIFLKGFAVGFKLSFFLHLDANRKLFLTLSEGKKQEIGVLQ